MIKTVRSLMKVADLLCGEASDISQGAPRHDMQEFLVQCGYDIRRAVADLITDHNLADEKDTAALLRARVPLRRCMRCGERVRGEGDTVLCDGVVSKLASLSKHEPVAALEITTETLIEDSPRLQSLLGYPVRFVEPTPDEVED